MLEVCNLSFDYYEMPLLHQVSFSLPCGTLLHLKGANGKGKSTLLKLLAGLLIPCGGRINFDGVSIEKNQAQYQQQLCYVGHLSGLSPMLTVYESIKFNIERTIDCHGIAPLLEQFSLSTLADSSCAQLSSGQRHRLSLIRLLIKPSKLWLLDEPLVALDESGVNLLSSLITSHLNKGGMVVMTSHQALPPICGLLQEYQL